MVVIDAALLIEAGFNKWVDKVVTVLRPKRSSLTANHCTRPVVR